jgi:hypothetical protein
MDFNLALTRRFGFTSLEMATRINSELKTVQAQVSIAMTHNWPYIKGLVTTQLLLVQMMI